MKKRFLPFLLVLFTLLLASAAFAAGDGNGENGGNRKRLELDEMVVTATREEVSVQNLPQSVSVLTEGDIAQATSNNVTDLLSREAAVSLKSFYGHDKFGGVDIRGMGDTFVSNVLVLVDGFRMNPPDQSGPDLSSISLSSIERIEVLRGAGSVLYGDGAVGGVVNIITKKGKGPPGANAHVSYGSYNTVDTRAGSGGGIGDFSYEVNAAYYDTDGYRDNSYLRKKDASGDLGYTLWDRLTLSASGAWHEDAYGLPGPLPATDAESRDKRTRTRYPDDNGKTTDKRGQVSADLELERFGKLHLARGYRSRDNDFILGYTPLLSVAEQTVSITEEDRSVDARYVLENEIFGRKSAFTCGLDHFRTDYVRTAPSYNERDNSRTESLGLFLLERFSVLDQVTLHGGYRHNHYEGRFRTDQRLRFGNQRVWVADPEVEREYNHDAYDLGVVWQPLEPVSLYASYATSFRVPNVDEFAQGAENLGPQEGRHWEAGVRYHYKAVAEVSVAFFHTTIEDEIYYGQDPDTLLITNRNYQDDTLRKGIEVIAGAYPLETVYVWANYTYLTATFEGTDIRVPLVPEHKASLGVEWTFMSDFLLAVTGTCVGDRVDGNDLTNTQYPRLSSYTVTDLKLSYTRGGFKVFCGVNNLFDTLYTTTGYSASYYPMPERNFYGGVEYAF